MVCTMVHCSSGLLSYFPLVRELRIFFALLERYSPVEKSFQLGVTRSVGTLLVTID